MLIRHSPLETLLEPLWLLSFERIEKPKHGLSETLLEPLSLLNFERVEEPQHIYMTKETLSGLAAYSLRAPVLLGLEVCNNLMANGSPLPLI